MRIAKGVVAGLDSGNIEVVVDQHFGNQVNEEIKVGVSLADTATDGSKDGAESFIWVLKKRTVVPTSITTAAGEPVDQWNIIPGNESLDITYDIGADLGAQGGDYVNQSVHESFDTATALGFTMADLTDEWRLANPDADTEAKVAAKLFSSGKNGTFVINSDDQITDHHSGFGDISAFKPTAFNDADGVGYSIVQTYSVAPVNGVGGFTKTYTISRRMRLIAGEVELEIMKTG